MVRQLFARRHRDHIEVLDASGTQIGDIGLPGGSTAGIRVSPDGRTAAVVRHIPAGDEPDLDAPGFRSSSTQLFHVDLDSGAPSAIVTKGRSGAAFVQDALWLDDETILVQEGRRILTMAPDGSSVAALGSLPGGPCSSPSLHKSPGGKGLHTLLPRSGDEVAYLIDPAARTLIRTTAAGWQHTWLDETSLAYKLTSGTIRVHDVASNTDRTLLTLAKVSKELRLHGGGEREGERLSLKLGHGQLLLRDGRLWFGVKRCFLSAAPDARFHVVTASAAPDGTDLRIEHQEDDLVTLYRHGNQGWNLVGPAYGDAAVAWAPEIPEFAKDPHVDALGDR